MGQAPHPHPLTQPASWKNSTDNWQEGIKAWSLDFVREMLLPSALPQPKPRPGRKSRVLALTCPHSPADAPRLRGSPSAPSFHVCA